MGESNEVINLIEFLISDQASYITGSSFNVDGGWLNMKKILALIPTRLNSRRLPAKALLMINNLPLVMHVYKRVKLSKKIDDVAICCDDNKIAKVAKKYGAKVIMTSKHHPTGTDRFVRVIK